MDKLISGVRHHIEDEERDPIPRLAQVCSAEELRELGAKVLRAKKMTPTRPHPSAPTSPR